MGKAMQNINPDPLGTPIYVKSEPIIPVWPNEKMFYLLAKDGLFLCRNHEWFQSCVVAKHGPAELFEQKEFATHNYPKLPRTLLEKSVGFFHHVFTQMDSESALILAWNRVTNQMGLICPDQRVSLGSVNYEIPNLPHHLALIGDIHSHCDMAPNPSNTDEGDEMKRAGLHIIVGHLNKEPPDFYCALVADGQRFEVAIHKVIEDYYGYDASTVSPEWMTKVTKKTYSYTYSHTKWDKETEKNDRAIIKRALAKFSRQDTCPTAEEVRKELFTYTKAATYLECERKAEKFVKAWPKIKAVYAKLTA